MFTFDTRIDISLMGRVIANRRRRDPLDVRCIPTEEGRRAAAPLLEARDAILTAPQPVAPVRCTYCVLANLYGPPSCADAHCPNPRPTPRRLTEVEKAEILREEAEEARRCCQTCWGRGTVPVGDAGNMELETNCPDCGHDYR